MQSASESKHGGYRKGSGRKKQGETKSRRIPTEITTDDIKIMAKYKNHDLALYNMELEGGVASIADKEKYETHKPNDKLLINNIEDHFLVKVSGCHRKELGILEDDILLVNKNIKSEHNSIVIVVNAHGKAVLKKMIREEDKSKLVSDNDNCADIHLDDNSVDRIWGVVTRVIREYTNAPLKA